eukprot:1819197-Rhodomonas_salina.1
MAGSSEKPEHSRSRVTDRAETVALGGGGEGGEKVDQAREAIQLPECLVSHFASSASQTAQPLNKRVGTKRGADLSAPGHSVGPD